MKKLSALAIILLSIVSFTCYGQVGGVDFTNSTLLSNFTNDYEVPFEELLDRGNGSYIILFKQTPVGYKHCLDRADRILSDNGGDFSQDRIIDDSMYPPYIDGLTDYYNMPYELKMSNAEVVLVWELTDEYMLKVFCNDLIFSVLLAPNDGLNDQGANSFGNQNLGRNAFGNQGDPNGSPGSDNYGTGGGLGNGPTYGGLGSRKAVGSLPLPNMSGCEITQKIVVTVEIVVDQNGKVESALVQSASYQDNCIWTMVVEAAKQSRFSVDRNANLKQAGWIKYTVVP